MINTKGAITVFISIVLSAIFLVVGTFVDAARIKLAQSQVQRASKTALSSLLACYNNDLKDEYGLFGLYIDNDSMLESFEEYFSKNLNISNGQNFLYDYNVENINIEQPFNLENRDVFEKQMMEFMKYRAPYEIAKGLISKINGIKNISSGAKVYQRKMETDQKANEIGKLQISLEDKTKLINESSIISKISSLKTELASVKINCDALVKEILELQKSYDNEKDEAEKQDLYDKIAKLQKSLSVIITKKDEIKNCIINSVNEFKSLNSEASEFANSIIAKKNELLNRIQGEFQYTEEKDGIKELQQAYKDSLTDIQKLIAEDNSASITGILQSNVTKCDSIINTASSNEDSFILALDNLEHLDNIDYKFNKAKPAQSDDEDNRDAVQDSVEDTLNTKDDLKTIESSLLKQLPSRKKVTEGTDNTLNNDNMSFEDDSYASSSLEDLASKESELGQLVSNITEQLYANEYIMGTFKHDVPLLKGEDKSKSYSLRSEDKAKRDAYFSRFEVEYIINGSKSESLNSKITKSEILAIRLISNVIHIYTDASKMTRVTALAAALSSWCAGLVTPLITTMLVFSWAMFESLYDLDQLMEGGKILLFKTKMQWKTDFSGAVTKKETTNVDNNPLALSYQDYLRIFLLLMNKDKKLARTQDLVQLNVGVSNPGFLIEDCKVLLKANTTVSMKNMFVSFPNFTSQARKNISRTYISEDMCIGY